LIISNCVINLSADKDRVFAEAFRVLKHQDLRHGRWLQEVLPQRTDVQDASRPILTEEMEVCRKTGVKYFELRTMRSTRSCASSAKGLRVSP